MASIREQILARIAAALTAANLVGTNVYRSRTQAVNQAIEPTIIIAPDEEEVEPRARMADLHRLHVTIKIVVRAEPWDSAADPISAGVLATLAGDAQLAALIHEIRLVRSHWVDEEADRTVGVLTDTYRVTYLSAANNLTTGPY